MRTLVPNNGSRGRSLGITATASSRLMGRMSSSLVAQRRAHRTAAASRRGRARTATGQDGVEVAVRSRGAAVDRDRVTRCGRRANGARRRGGRDEGTPARRGGRRRQGRRRRCRRRARVPVAPGTAQADRGEVALGRRRDRLVAGAQGVGGVGGAPGERAPLEHLVELGGGAGGEQRGGERQQSQKPTTPHRGSLPARLRARPLDAAPCRCRRGRQSATAPGSWDRGNRPIVAAGG